MIAMVSTLEKIRILGAAGKFDICASSAVTRANIKDEIVLGNSRIGNASSCGICHSYTPDGRCISLFKVLFTNHCIYSCKYCFTCVQKNKVMFTPEEYANVFMKLYEANYVEGLFLTSGIFRDADYTTEKLIEVVRLLRNHYHFRGYIHFKCLPGTDLSLIKEAANFADRMSVNVELPNKSYLSEVAEQKDYENDIIKRQFWIRGVIKQKEEEKRKEQLDQSNIEPIQAKNFNSHFDAFDDDIGMNCLASRCQISEGNFGIKLDAGQTTQFVLGAAGEPDKDILNRLFWEYKHVNLRRGYFSAFSPIQGTALETLQPTPLERENRLYQADWLYRVYKISSKELMSIINDSGNLPVGDPKLHLAFESITRPIDVNKATYKELIRIPGIGPIAAKRILNLQRSHVKIVNRKQLQNLGVVLKRAEPWLIICDSNQTMLDAFIEKSQKACREREKMENAENR